MSLRTRGSVSVLSLSVLILILVTGSLAQLDLSRPGPPYHSHNDGRNRNQQNQPYRQQQQLKIRIRPSRHAGPHILQKPLVLSQLQNLPTISKHAAKSLYNALASGHASAVGSLRSQYAKVLANNPFRIQGGKLPYSNSRPSLNLHLNNAVQTAHVHIPYASRDAVLPVKGMPNIVVKYQGSSSSPYSQQVQQYSEIEPVFQPAAEPFVTEPELQAVPEYSQPIVHVVQYPQDYQQTITQQVQNTNDIVPVHQFHDMKQVGSPAHQNDQTGPNDQTQTQNQAESLLKVQVSSGKRRRRPPNRHKKKRPNKGKKGKPFPVFATIGKGLDGLNGVRLILKRGTGKVVAKGVKLGGKMAYLKAKVAAKVIKVASSI